MPRITPRPARGPLLRAAYRYARHRFGSVPEPFAVMAHRRPVLTSVARFEMSVERRWRALPAPLRELAVLRAALTVDCPWCVDFGSMLSAHDGLPAEKVENLTRWRTSDVYDDVERLVLEYAEAMSTTPLTVTDELVAALREHLSDEQVVELTMQVALENQRSRFNTALGIGSQGYAASCPVPQPVP